MFHWILDATLSLSTNDFPDQLVMKNMDFVIFRRQSQTFSDKQFQIYFREPQPSILHVL